MKNIKSFLQFAGLFLLIGSFYGCGTFGEMFNPYDDEFACPYSDPGMCTSVKNAYDASLADQEEGSVRPYTPTNASEDAAVAVELCKTGNCPKVQQPAARPQVSPRDAYQQRRFETLAGLIQDDEPPIVVPPEVVRVLILSYTGTDNEMFGFRYAYFFATEPSWIPSTAISD